MEIINENKNYMYWWTRTVDNENQLPSNTKTPNSQTLLWTWLNDIKNKMFYGLISESSHCMLRSVGINVSMSSQLQLIVESTAGICHG